VPTPPKPGSRRVPDRRLTPQETAWLTAFAETGRPWREAAAHLRLTPAQIKGKVHRLGLSNGRRGRAPAPSPPDLVLRAARLRVEARLRWCEIARRLRHPDPSNLRVRVTRLLARQDGPAP
jgi:hypothetical protein